MSKSLEYVISQWFSLKLDKEMSFRDVLYHLYIEENHSVRGIAGILKVSVGMAHKWLHDYDVVKEKLKW